MQESATQSFFLMDNYSWNKLSATLVATPTLWPPLSKHLQVCTLSYLLINAQDPSHLDLRIQIGVTIPIFYGPVHHKKKKKRKKEEEEEEAVWCERNQGRELQGNCGLSIQLYKHYGS